MIKFIAKVDTDMLKSARYRNTHESTKNLLKQKSKREEKAKRSQWDDWSWSEGIEIESRVGDLNFNPKNYNKLFYLARNPSGAKGLN